MKFLYGFTLFFGLCFAWLLVPIVSNAQTVSGYNTYYIQQTSNGTLPDNYSSTLSGLAFPTNTYTQLGAYQNQSYNVIRAMDLQFPNIEFVNGNTYTFTINFDYGSYIYPSWPNTAAISTAFGIRSCPYGTCTATMTWQNDSTHQSVNTLQLKLVHKASANQTGKTFGIGPMTSNTGLFYNAYSSQQGIRINSATVDIIVDPNYQNTQDIINNQNKNTQKEIESQQVCSDIIYRIDDSNYLNLTKGWLSSNGVLQQTTSEIWRVSDYVPMSINKILYITSNFNGGNSYICFYDTNKILQNCFQQNVTSFTLTPSFNGFVRFNYNHSSSSYFIVYNSKSCKNGNQALNDTLTDSSVNDSKINSFFNDLDFYDNNNFSSLITSPINFLNSLNDTCTPINLQLFGQTVSLPCGTSVFWERNLPYISTFRVFWNVLFGGALIYTLGLLLVKNISDAIDPTKDNIGGFKI